MYCLGLFVVVYEEIKMLLHDLSWIPISVQSIPYPVFEICLSKLNKNNNNNKKFENWLFWINQVPNMQFKPFPGNMLFVMIRISLMCQRLDLIDTESQTWKSQMYGYNAGRPVSSLLSTTVLSDIFPLPLYSNCHCDCLSLGLDTRCAGRVGMP